MGSCGVIGEHMCREEQFGGWGVPGKFFVGSEECDTGGCWMKEFKERGRLRHAI
jgi:hypothetical protein